MVTDKEGSISLFGMSSVRGRLRNFACLHGLLSLSGVIADRLLQRKFENSHQTSSNPHIHHEWSLKSLDVSRHAITPDPPVQSLRILSHDSSAWWLWGPTSYLFFNMDRTGKSSHQISGVWFKAMESYGIHDFCRKILGIPVSRHQ